MIWKKGSPYRLNHPPGRFADWHRTNKVTLYNGEEYDKVCYTNDPDEKYFQAGATTVLVKQGTNHDQYAQQFGTPNSKQTVFWENPQLLQNFRPNKTTNLWNQNDDCIPFADFVCNVYGIPRKLIWTAEAYNESYHWRMAADYAGQQMKWIAQRFAQRFAPTGSHYHPEYGGTFDIGFRFDGGEVNNWVDILNSGPDAIHTFIKSVEGAYLQYWGNKLWEECFCLQSNYRLGDRPDYIYAVQSLLQTRLNVEAMKASAVTTKRPVAVYDMNEGSQLIGYSDLFPDQPTNAGLIYGDAHNQWAYSTGAFVHLGELAEGAKWMMECGDCFRHGADLSVLPESDYNLNFRPNGNPYTRRPVTYVYQPGGAGVSAAPRGNWDISWAALRQRQLIYEHVGHTTAQYCPNRVGTNPYGTTDAAYLIRKYNEREVIAHKYVGNNGNIVISGFTSPYSKRNGPVEVQFQAGDNPTFELPCNQSFIYFGKV